MCSAYAGRCVRPTAPGRALKEHYEKGELHAGDVRFEPRALGLVEGHTADLREQVDTREDIDVTPAFA
jgi:hypothetical protein